MYTNDWAVYGVRDLVVAVEYEEQFKEQNDFLKKQYLNQYRSNANIRKTHVSSLQGERTRLMCASGSR
jgi:hypothetical protein